MSTDSTSTQGIKSYRVYRLKQHHARDCLLQQISIYTMQCSSGAPLKVLRRWKNILLMEKGFLSSNISEEIQFCQRVFMIIYKINWIERMRSQEDNEGKVIQSQQGVVLKNYWGVHLFSDDWVKSNVRHQFSKCW